jgi:predicted nucleotidyltransferase
MYGLSDRNIEELRSILASIPHIEEAILYGSRARGDYKPASDIDLSLKGEKLTRQDVALLDDKLYYSYIPYYFDTNIYSELTNQELLESIDRNGKIFFQRQNAKQ